MMGEFEQRSRESTRKRTVLPLASRTQAADEIRPAGRTRLALVGFGEIGAATAVACAQDPRSGVEVVQIFNRQLSARDACARVVYSRFVDPTDVSCWVGENQGYLRILDQVSKLTPHESMEEAASRLDDVDVVVFSVGRYAQDRACLESFLSQGRAKAVIVTCASRVADLTMVAGFNHHRVDPERHKIIALGSCTGNCAVPMLSVVEELFGAGAIRGIYSVAPHSKTNSQQIGNKGMDPKNEGILGNLIPTSTGLTKLLQQPDFFSVLGDSVDAVSIRTPTEDVSLLCMAMDVEGAGSATTADVRTAFRKASRSPRWRGIMGLCEARGSKVFWKDRRACVVYEPHVKLMPKFLKSGKRAPLSTISVMAAYANVFGYSCQIVRSVQALKLGRAPEAAERLRQPALAG